MKKNRKTILIVDDIETNIDILVELLDSEYDVVVALNGKDALSIVLEDDIDLILLDIMMPQMDGYEVCKRLKSKDEIKNIPVIFLTSKIDENAIEKAYDVGGADYVSKPFRPKELLKRVKNQLELRSLIYALEEKVQEQVDEITHAHELMLQNSRMAQMGEMISMIAHQWRQPLGAISVVSLGLITKIKMNAYDMSDKNDIKACQDKIMNSSHKIDLLVQGLSRTIDDFRNFFKPDKDIKILPLSIPISKSLQIIESSLHSHHIKIIQELKSSKKIEMYDSELMQVMLNIFKNSQDNFMKKKILDAHIIINSKDTDTGVEINFIDNGGGIDKDIIASIFDPYFSTKSEKNGTGLGLAMSKTIIDSHHKGSIIATNTKDGVCFTITLRDQIAKNSKT
ncbi:MAG: hybrid sensor histidine kinase/response regulator [Campylobacterota bacterium]|nr:hybrid sensor histidine kinase/response regulator [Campylobacterota bacterium]